MKNLKLLGSFFLVVFFLGGCASKQFPFFWGGEGTPGGKKIESFGKEKVIIDFVYIKDDTCAINISVAGEGGFLKYGSVHVFPQGKNAKTSIVVDGKKKIVFFSCDERKITAEIKEK